MYDLNEIYNFIFDNLKQIIFPEEWLSIDLEMPKQELLLLLVADRRGEIIMSQAADYINIPMSTATGIVDRLVKKGYIVRDRSTADRRIVAVKLTEEGRRFTAAIKEHISDYIRKINNVLTDEERDFSLKIIIKIMNVLQEQSRKTEKEISTGSEIKRIEID